MIQLKKLYCLKYNITRDDMEVDINLFYFYYYYFKVSSNLKTQIFNEIICSF